MITITKEVNEIVLVPENEAEDAILRHCNLGEQVRFSYRLPNTSLDGEETPLHKKEFVITFSDDED
jgi:hypothetical protein